MNIMDNFVPISVGLNDLKQNVGGGAEVGGYFPPGCRP